MVGRGQTCAETAADFFYCAASLEILFNLVFSIPFLSFHNFFQLVLSLQNYI